MATVAGVAGISRGALDRLAIESPVKDELLFLPNGKHLKIMSLGHSNLLADAIYLWAIQYYSNYEREERQRYVEHIFGNVITELDPHYLDAYWIGALIMVVENGDLDGGVRLLEKGMGPNPDAWILPYLAAWECYHGRQYARAAAFFERAARISGAPDVVRRMRAGMISKGGDLETSLDLWRAILEDPASDKLSLVIAERKVRELHSRVDVARLQAAVDRFRNHNRRYPVQLGELVHSGYIRDLPSASDGRPYRYDALSGIVLSESGRILGEP
jgi:tetratricopeptide (TPR) repeat protein